MFVPQALLLSSDKNFRKLGEKLDMVPSVADLEYLGEEGCSELVMKGTHTHIETFSYLKSFYTGIGISDKIYYMKELIYEGNLVFYYQKNTPWKNKFDKIVRRLVENGFVRKWYKDIMAKFIGRPQEVNLLMIR